MNSDALQYRERWLNSEAEVERLRHELELVLEQVESCCSRAGLCIGTARIREALDA